MDGYSRRYSEPEFWYKFDSLIIIIIIIIIIIHISLQKNGSRKIKSIYIYIKNILGIYNRIFRNMLETLAFLSKFENLGKNWLINCQFSSKCSHTSLKIYKFWNQNHYRTDPQWNPANAANQTKLVNSRCESQICWIIVRYHFRQKKTLRISQPFYWS